MADVYCLDISGSALEQMAGRSEEANYISGNARGEFRDSR
jgi:hypothetical protein